VLIVSFQLVDFFVVSCFVICVVMSVQETVEDNEDLGGAG